MKDEKIILELLLLLEKRGGFDGWWGNIDEDIKIEIIIELAYKLNELNKL